MNYFCKNIHYIRTYYHLTQQQMCRILGISPNTLHKIELGGGNVRLSTDMLCKLCDYFQISGDAVLDLDFQSLQADPAAYPPL